VGGPLLDSELGAVLSPGLLFILGFYPTYSIHRVPNTRHMVEILSPSGFVILGHLTDQAGNRDPNWKAYYPHRSRAVPLGDKARSLSAVLAKVHQMEGNSDQFQLFNGCQHLGAL
jgi:hypothetical protein